MENDHVGAGLVIIADDGALTAATIERLKSLGFLVIEHKFGREVRIETLKRFRTDLSVES